MKSKLCLLLVSLLFGCSYFSHALTEQDIAQYTQAYGNIARAAPTLAAQKRDSHALDILTCIPCYGTLNQAVKQAGYADFKAFLIADARIHLAMRAYVYLEISKFAGETAQGASPVQICANLDTQSTPAADPELRTQCARLRTLGAYVEKIGKVILKLATQLGQDGDIAAVAKQQDAITRAWTNPALPAEFLHGKGMSLDD